MHDKGEILKELDLHSAWEMVAPLLSMDAGKIKNNQHLMEVQKALLYIGARAEIEGEALEEGYHPEIRFYQSVECDCGYLGRKYKDGPFICTKCWRVESE